MRGRDAKKNTEGMNVKDRERVGEREGEGGRERERERERVGERGGWRSKNGMSIVEESCLRHEDRKNVSTGSQFFLRRGDNLKSLDVGVRVRPTQSRTHGSTCAASCRGWFCS